MPLSLRPLFLAAALSLLLAAPAAAVVPPVSGAMPPEVSDAIANGLLGLQPRPAGLPVSVQLNRWYVPIILVSFADDPLTYGPSDFEFALFDTTGRTATGSAYDYYQWVSHGRFVLSGRVVAVVRLPHDKVYYGYNSWGLNRISTPNNDAGLVRDAIYSCDPTVNWADFDLDRDGYVDMLWVVHAGIGGEASTNRNDLWSITSGLSGYWNNGGAYETNDPYPGTADRHMLIDRFSMLPELSWVVPGTMSEIGVYCHEFGHALGLPDLYDTADGGVHNTGPGNWSLMSTGVYGGDGHSPQYPVHPGAWSTMFLGWAGSVRPVVDTVMTLQPIITGGAALDLSFQGDPLAEHFLCEYRTRQGFDRTLPADGLLVSHVDESVMGHGIQGNIVNAGLQPGLQVVEADGGHELVTGGDRGDGGDVYPGSAGRTLLEDLAPAPSTRTFSGAPTSLALSDIAITPSGLRVRAQVRSPGWLSPTDWTPTAYAPVGAGFGALAPLADGTLAMAEARTVNGHGAIVLRERSGDLWSAGIEVSGPSADASEPAIAPLGNGRDLAVVWVDGRAGLNALWYRARVDGAWLPEQALAPGSGEAHAPRVAVDARGGIEVAWLARSGVLGRIQFMRFTYLSPWGQPVPLSSYMSAVEPPALAMGPDGGSWVLWSEGSGTSAVARFRRFVPDSGLSPTFVLAYAGFGGLSTPEAAVDPAGTLHLVWLEGRGSATAMHYQRRPTLGPAAPLDSLLETAPGTVQDVRLACDSDGDLHVLDDLLRDGGVVARYRRRHAVRGWDAWPTRLTEGMPPTYARGVAAEGPSRVTTLLLSDDVDGPHWIERRRTSDLPASTAVVRRAVPLDRAPRVGPNPLRAGAALVAEAAAGSGVLEVFDLAGRQVATAAFRAEGGRARARVDGGETRRWPAGVYFVRARGEGRAAPIVVVR